MTKISDLVALLGVNVDQANDLLEIVDMSETGAARNKKITIAQLLSLVDMPGALEFKGTTDCSANPNYPAAEQGDFYVVSVAGKIGGASGTTVEVGDAFFAKADNAGGTQAAVGTSWTAIQANIVGSTGVDVEDEGVSEATGVTTLNFTGAGVTATDAGGGQVDVAIPGGIGGIDVEDEGVVETSGATILNFVGAGVTAADAGGGQVDITIAGGGSGVDVEDEGVAEATGATTLNFTGAGVTATDQGGGVVDVNIPGGGGGSSFERTRVVPVVADFTLENAGTASISDVTSGIKLTCPSATSNFRFVRHNAALPTPPWTMIARIAPLQPRTDTTQFQRCLAVRNSNGRMLMMHDRAGSSVLTVDRWTGYTSPGVAGFSNLGATRMFEMRWQRITFDGTTFAFGCSPDGHDDTFYDFYTELASTHLTASGGSIAEVGWGNWVDSGPYTIAELLQSFEVF